MNEEILKLTQKMDYNESVSATLVIDVQEKIKIKFPDDYIEFMLYSNGAEGFVGESYLAIWRLEEIVPLNDGYMVDKFVPGLILFGSDGGGEAYAFDTRFTPTQYVEIPYIGMSFETKKFLGISFLEFLNLLHTRWEN